MPAVFLPLLLAVTMLAACACYAVGTAALGAAGVSAMTDCGEVMGVTEGGASIFKGIPYAAPPVGERRWRATVGLHDAGLCWNGTLAAKRFGPVCPQSPGSLDVGLQDESCLTLNVWTPSVSAKLPVMVWVHGGR